MKISWIRVVVAVTVLLSCGVSESSAQIGLQPIIKQLVVPAGGQKTYLLEASNSGPGTYDCALTVSDLDVTLTGAPFAAPTSMPRGCAPWVTMTPPTVRLGPRGKQRIVLSVRAPYGTVGTYSAFLDFRADAVPARNSGAAVISHARFVSILVCDVKGVGVLRSQIATKDIQVSPGRRGTKSAPWAVGVRVENSGNTKALLSGAVELRDASGKMLETVPMLVGSGILLPSVPREYDARGKAPLADGAYIVTTVLKPYRGLQSAQKSVDFLVTAGAVEVKEPSPEVLKTMLALIPKLSVSPTELNLVVPAGGRQSGVISLSNSSAEPLACVLSVVPWRLSPDGNVELCEETAQPLSAVTWVSLDRTDVSIPGKGKVIVRVTAAPTKGATGERYAAVAVNLAGSTQPPAVSNTTAISVGVKGSLSKHVVARNLEVKKQANTGFLFALSLENTGNTRVLATGSLLVSSAGGTGDVRNVAEFNEVLVLPGTKRTLKFSWMNALLPGDYVATASVAAGDGETGTTASTTFTEAAANRGVTAAHAKAKPINKSTKAK